MNTLVAKIAKASTVVGALKADKRNQAQSYDYISADKVLERVGDALAAEGIVIFPSVTSEATEVVATGNGKSRFDCTVHFGMIISDGESQIELPWCGRGSDFSVPDKALYKAITSGHKYFLMKLLNVGVGNEDGEHESFDDGQAPQKAQEARKAQTTPTATTKGETPPHKRLWAIGISVFGTDWDMAREWLIAKWTAHVTPDNTRSSAGDLGDDEKTMLGDYMNENIAGLQKAWPKQKAIILQTTQPAAEPV